MECVCVEGNSEINPNLSPLMFYSDEEIDEEETGAITEDSSSLEDSTVINVIKSRDERLVSQIRLVMTGVPPPPSFTVPKWNTSDILRLWKDNQHLITDIQDSDIEKHVATSVEEAKTISWPHALQIEAFGVHYNKSKASEELEWLCSKYRERFVGNETSSWVNSLQLRSPVRTASAKKRARYRGWGHSPGRRLSHLARRRRAFTSANLQSVAGKNSGLPRDKKMILVEIKKTNCRQKMKSRNSSTKKQPIDKTRNNAKISSNPIRALFQSPDDKPERNLKSVSATVKQSLNQIKIQNSKRVLWPNDEKSARLSEKKKEFNINGKRGRTSLTPSPRKKCNRSLFCDVTMSKSSSTPKADLQSLRKNSPLSNPHQKKLLWAISQALKEEGIRMNHQIFQSCLSVLNGPCMALWIWKTSKETPRGSTSENMLVMVKQFGVKTVIEQVQTNSSASNLVSLRLGLMKKVQSIKDIQNVNLKSDETLNVTVGNSNVRTDKENISSAQHLVAGSSKVVLKKSPLKDINVKCATPMKINLSEDCNSKCNIETKSDNDPFNGYDVFLKSPLEDNFKYETSVESRLNEDCNSRCTTETMSVKSDSGPFNGFNVDSNDFRGILKNQSPLKLNLDETNKISFSEMLSWNSDPISRLHIKAPDLNPSVLMVNPIDSKIKQISINNDSSNISFEVRGQTFNKDKSVIEFQINDDETRSSSIYSFDLNNFVDESRTCFEFTNVNNIQCSEVCSFEET